MFARPSSTAALWDQRFDNHLPLTALPPVCLCIATWRNNLAFSRIGDWEKDNEPVQWQERHLGPGQALLHHRQDGHRHRPDSGEQTWPFKNLPKLRTLMVFELNQVLGQRYKLKPICKSLPKLLDFQECDDASVKMLHLQSSKYLLQTLPRAANTIWATLRDSLLESPLVGETKYHQISSVLKVFQICTVWIVAISV